LAQTYALLLYPLVHVITLEITGVSAYYVYRQKMTAYGYAKAILILVHVLFIGVVISEFLRTLLLSVAFVAQYTDADLLLILGDVSLLTLLAVSVYLLQSGVAGKRLLSALWEKKRQAGLFLAYIGFIVFTGAYLLIESPYTVAEIGSISGAQVPASMFTPFYLNFLLVVLLVFILYPSLLLFQASRRIAEPSVKRVLRLLPIAWSGIGAELLFFNGYLLSVGLDATPFGYLVASMAFGITALVFRRASLLTGFFVPARPTAAVSEVHPFTERLATPTKALEGRTLLLEANPSLSYEQAVVDFVVEFLSRGHLVYIFSSKGNPVYEALSRVEGLRFYIFSTKVTYPKPGDQPFQVLIPSNDQASLLDVIEKTITLNKGQRLVLVYDNITDMILSSGFESSYKFLKEVNELVSGSGVTALFLMTLGAHDERTVSLTRSLFPDQLVYDVVGLKMMRTSVQTAP
jgi:hypothetical protein